MTNLELEDFQEQYGLLFDGMYGYSYTGESVISYAIDLGFPGEPVNADHEHFDDVITEAEDWLNNNAASPGDIYQFVDGSFYYERINEDDVWL
tara:strand:+ start:39 stop:317 length:279 start_codon:yes stop_codon:yes gene_type:complete